MTQCPAAETRRTKAAPLLLLAVLGLGPLAAAGCSGCSEPAPPAAAECQLSSDLPAATVDVALRNAAAQGPRAERIAGQGLGASALPPRAAPAPAAAITNDGGAALAPAPAAMPATPAPSTGPAPASGGDLRWDLEPYGAIAAAAKGELEPLPAAGADVPDLWRDPGGTWVAIGGRAQVLLVSRDALAAQVKGDAQTGTVDIPNRFTALTEPWLKGKVALAAPTGGASLAHFAALYQVWGDERMRAWLDGLKQNQAQVLASDAEVRLAVVSGAAVVGLLGSDEAAKAAASAAKVDVVYPNQKSIGTFVWPTALSRPRNAAHADAASRLAERLADRATEQLLVAREPGFLPLRAGIPVPPGVRGASSLVVVSVNPARIVEEIGLRKAELEAWTKEMQAKR